ncbi:hypothetical protein KFE25_006440 [Diacronema lutheri]|uniref:Uncharacterized protein n=1 Tax=Diacronema lutheri TaxID=2081491 RepID=A0A8J6CHA3_DIALT|nr:hypothetical protein KFE25_006440 [Diacronema lutheri]
MGVRVACCLLAVLPAVFAWTAPRPAVGARPRALRIAGLELARAPLAAPRASAMLGLADDGQLVAAGVRSMELLAGGDGQSSDPMQTLAMVLAVFGTLAGGALVYLLNVVFPERRL